MEMLVGIDVIERQARRRESLKLGFDLPRQLPAHLRQEEYGRAGAHHIGAKKAVGVDQIGNGGGRQRGPSFHQHQMQADAQAGHRLGAADRVGRCRSRHHQARGSEDTFLVGAFDRVVDLECGAEIVRGDNQLFQETIMSSRVCRNWKNSTPSRNRRTSIEREVSISPTISAIFEGRK